MGATNLRLVTETIDLDSPDEGLNHTLEGIADDLQQVGEVRRDVRSWAMKGAAVSAVVTVGAIAALAWAFMPGAPPPSIVIQPPPVAVVVSSPAPAPAPAAPVALLKVDNPPVRQAELSAHRAFSALWASRPKTALRDADRVLSVEPHNVDALAARAFALFELRKDRAARAEVKKALKLDPKHPLANVLRGMMAQVDHDAGSALAHYEKYLRQRPFGALATELQTVRSNLSPEVK